NDTAAWVVCESLPEAVWKTRFYNPVEGVVLVFGPSEAALESLSFLRADRKITVAFGRDHVSTRVIFVGFAQQYLACGVRRRDRLNPGSTEILIGRLRAVWIRDGADPPRSIVAVCDRFAAVAADAGKQARLVVGVSVLLPVRKDHRPRSADHVVVDVHGGASGIPILDEMAQRVVRVSCIP